MLSWAKVGNIFELRRDNVLVGSLEFGTGGAWWGRAFGTTAGAFSDFAYGQQRLEQIILAGGLEHRPITEKERRLYAREHNKR